MTLQPSDSLCTPDFILWRVRNLGTIALDACSNPQSRVNAEIELSLEAGDDGLAADWLATCTTGLAFINPPYGRGHLRPWTAKIATEAARGCEIVSLLPNDTTTQWWATVNGTCQARCDISRRVAFQAARTSRVRSSRVCSTTGRDATCSRTTSRHSARLQYTQGG